MRALRFDKVSLTLSPISIKIAQKPYKIGSSGPKALAYESFEGKGMRGFAPGLWV